MRALPGARARHRRARPARTQGTASGVAGRSALLEPPAAASTVRTTRNPPAARAFGRERSFPRGGTRTNPHDDHAHTPAVPPAARRRRDRADPTQPDRRHPADAVDLARQPPDLHADRPLHGRRTDLDDAVPVAGRQRLRFADELRLGLRRVLDRPLRPGDLLGRPAPRSLARARRARTYAGSTCSRPAASCGSSTAPASSRAAPTRAPCR